MYRIGFIGIGNMGSAMAASAIKRLGSDNVLLSNRSFSKAESFSRLNGGRALKSNISLVEEAEFIVLAVKPLVLPEVLREIAPALKASIKDNRRKVIVSLAAGVKIQDIKAILKERFGEDLPASLPVIRCLPTIYAYLGCGMMSCSVENETSRAAYEELKEDLGEAGTFVLMDESEIDLANTASACTPAFTALFIEAMADGMVKMGMSRKAAVEYVARGVYGGAAMVLDGGMSPSEVKDAVCSPGGTTIAGVRALEENRFRYAAMEAVISSSTKVLSDLKV